MNVRPGLVHPGRGATFVLGADGSISFAKSNLANGMLRSSAPRCGCLSQMGQLRDAEATKINEHLYMPRRIKQDKENQLASPSGAWL